MVTVKLYSGTNDSSSRVYQPGVTKGASGGGINDSKVIANCFYHHVRLVCNRVGYKTVKLMET